MLPIAAQTILIAAAIFFLSLGSIALVRPARARVFLLGFAASALKHYVELSARLVVGGAMLLFAPRSSTPMALTAFGWLIIGTTAVMAVVPWRIHRRFAEAAVPLALRFLPMIGIASLAIGGLLLWSVLDPGVA
jgi:uncharacterized protein YjeT (DUF2065 family)